MSDMRAEDSPILPCGRDASIVWEQAGQGHPDAHEAQCPYCTAVRDQYAALIDVSAAYVGQPIAAPPVLTESVMRAVLNSLRPGRPLPLGSDIGAVFATDTAMANALRIMLDGDQAVIPRRCRIDLDPGARTDQAALRIWLTVAVSYEHFTRHQDRVVRQRVIDSVADLFDRPVDSVEIDIVDVFTTRPGTTP